LTLVAEDSGLRRVALRASRTPDGGVVNGYALENLFLRVSPARRIALVGSGTPNRLSEGQASVVFDVRSASPTLPRPYATNFSFDRFPAGEVVSALSAVVTWPDVRSPKVQSTLNATVPMPDPPVVGDGDRGMLYLLDVSGRDDRLGVALAPFEGVAPALEDNRLVWPMTAMALTMLPQVLWEPVQSIDTPLTSP
jgi:hypothetical protein